MNGSGTGFADLGGVVMPPRGRREGRAIGDLEPTVTYCEPRQVDMAEAALH